MNTLNVDEKLGVDKFYVDEGNAHIKLVDNPDPAVYALLEIACPAGLYKRDDKNAIQFDCAGCLECGTCRVLGYGTVVEKWEFPQGTMGVEYRFG